MVSAGKVIVLPAATVTVALVLAVGAVDENAAVFAAPPVVAPMFATLPVTLMGFHDLASCRVAVLRVLV
ncbi:hypothetical protein FQZ97_814250 [compost metagenome]